MSNLLYENLAQEGTTVIIIILYIQSNATKSKELAAPTAQGRAQLVEGTVMYKSFSLTNYHRIYLLNKLSDKVVWHPLR